MEDEQGLLMGTETSKQAEAPSWEKSVTLGIRMSAFHVDIHKGLLGTAGQTEPGLWCPGGKCTQPQACGQLFFRAIPRQSLPQPVLGILSIQSPSTLH